MNIGLVSLLLLLAAIIIGFLRNANVGILCIGFGMLLAILFPEQVAAKDLIAGFSGSLFIQMCGVTYLFAIIQGNGTLNLMARKMVALTGKRRHLIPVVMYFLGFFLSSVGPGSIPVLAIIPVIAIPVAVQAGINPIMTAIIGDLGAMSGRMSPLTPESAVVRTLMEEQGLVGDTVPIMIGMTITALVIYLVVFVYYKGWRIDENAAGVEAKAESFSKYQWLSLLGLAALAVGVLFFGWNAGLTGFLVGSVLIVLGGNEEKKAVRAIPWNVILMVLGVGVLMNVVTLSGGIDILVGTLEKVMNGRTATCIMSLVAGLMSFFSSGLGVVFPTLIPTASDLASGLHANAYQIVAVIVIGGSVSGFTPLSTTGALIMAGISQQENAEERFPQNRMFIELFAVSFIALAVLALLAFAGVFGIFIR